MRQSHAISDKVVTALVTVAIEKKKGLQLGICNHLISLMILGGVAGFELANPCTPCAGGPSGTDSISEGKF